MNKKEIADVELYALQLPHYSPLAYIPLHNQIVHSGDNLNLDLRWSVDKYNLDLGWVLDEIPFEVAQKLLDTLILETTLIREYKIFRVLRSQLSDFVFPEQLERFQYAIGYEFDSCYNKEKYSTLVNSFQESCNYFLDKLTDHKNKIVNNVQNTTPLTDYKHAIELMLKMMQPIIATQMTAEFERRDIPVLHPMELDKYGHKIVLLNELGIIDYLEKQYFNPAEQTHKGKTYLAKLINAITGINENTVRNGLTKYKTGTDSDPYKNTAITTVNEVFKTAKINKTLPQIGPKTKPN